MTIRQLLLRDGVGGQAPALFGSWVSFDTRGIFPAGYRLPPGAASTSQVTKMPFAEPSVRRSHQPIGGLIRCSGPEDALQWSARSFSAGCLEWPRAVSGCLAPAATFFHRPGDWVLHAGALRATSAKLPPR